MIEHFLNKKNTLRNLTDEEFENILPQLAIELESVDYHYYYQHDVLLREWAKLRKFKNTTGTTSSGTRVGMKICEHFFPNFFDIENNKGQSFSNLWKSENFEKIFRWNRKSHSTAYLSELRRGLYFTKGLTKNTMYRPHLAKMICDSHDCKYVLDPSCGWGGRMLGAVASGKHYIGFETNPTTYEGLLSICKALSIEDKVTIYHDGSENMDKYDIPKVGIVLTSPPYFNLEVYDDNKNQSENQYSTYEEWRDNWLFQVIRKSNALLEDDGIACWNTHNVGKMKLIDDIVVYQESQGYKIDREFHNTSPARQSNQNTDKSKRNKDSTIIYKKHTDVL